MVVNVLLLGLGLSGKAAAAHLLDLGHFVTAADGNVARAVQDPEVRVLQERGMRLVDERQAEELSISQFSLFVPSPGVPRTHPLYVKAKEAQLEIAGDVEIALRSLHVPLLAVTGTNGKTTVVQLIRHLLQAKGEKVRAVGNVGDPICRSVKDVAADEILVVELSSFQLETMTTRAFDAAVVLNITPDHLDRYDSLKEYAAAKAQLKNCMKEGAPLFVHEETYADYPDLFQGAQTFGSKRESTLWTDRKGIYSGNTLQVALPEQKGMHDCENATAAWALTSRYLTPEIFSQALSTFTKPPHRIEWVAEIKGVAFYDDSKGTNLDATLKAVQAVPGKVILIAGGVHKGASYKVWLPLFQSRVKQVFALGEAATLIMHDLKEHLPVVRVATLEEAVEKAHAAALPGETVLLSPGCASFDQFQSYAHRGEVFQKCVKNLKE